MANLFDVKNAPLKEPTKLVVGDFVMWKRADLVVHYPQDSFSAEYVARITGGGNAEIKIQQDPNSTSEYYLFKVSSIDSANFHVGVYHWQLEITEMATGERVVVSIGEFETIADLDVNQSDPRTHEEVMLAKIESLLEGRADSDVSEYSVAGRSLTKLSFNELMGTRDRYKAEVVRIKKKAAIAQGRKTSSSIKVRFE